MRIDLYQAETQRIAQEQGGLLDEAAVRIGAAQPISRLEQNGVLHALQLIIENAIGKAKHSSKPRAKQYRFQVTTSLRHWLG